MAFSFPFSSSQATKVWLEPQHSTTRSCRIRAASGVEVLLGSRGPTIKAAQKGVHADLHTRLPTPSPCHPAVARAHFFLLLLPS